MRSLEVLRKINTITNKNVISEEEFNEELDNVSDFIVLKEDFSDLLTIIEKNNLEDKRWVADRLVDLHLKLSYSEWHLEQIHELVDRLMVAYGKQLKIIHD